MPRKRLWTACADHNLHAFSGSLPHPALEERSFDVITMWQALEHVHQPLEILQSAHQLLCPGGKIIITVPNIDCLAFHLFGTAWNGLDLPRHLVHFSPTTLRLMLKRAGFRPGRVTMVRRSWLAAFLGATGHAALRPKAALVPPA